MIAYPVVFLVNLNKYKQIFALCFLFYMYNKKQSSFPKFEFSMIIWLNEPDDIKLWHFPETPVSMLLLK